MLKDETWRPAGELFSGDRVMPSDVRLREVSATSESSYWQVHQPNHDSEVRDDFGDSSTKRRWCFVHRLVGDELLRRGRGQIVHHVDENTMNNSPENLEIVTSSEHASAHIAGIDNTKFFPEWTEERRRRQADKMKGNAFSLGNVLSVETRMKMSVAGKGRRKTEEWKRKIGNSQPTKIRLDRKTLESAYVKAGTVFGAAKMLGVSWGVVKRELERHDLLVENGNHRVAFVEFINSDEAVYDLEVPKYHNFVANGVVVHNSALDIYADDSTQEDSTEGKVLWVESDDESIKDELMDMFYKRIDIENHIWGMSRGLCKMGNEYQEIVVGDNGVVGLNYLPARTMRRVENKKGDLLGFMQTFSDNVDFTPEQFEKFVIKGGVGTNDTRDVAAFEDWRIAHMRLTAKYRESLYGWSVIDPARWVWKRLMLLEDAVLVYKLTRSPSRYAFYIDVGKVPKHEAEKILRQAMQMLKKRKFVMLYCLI